MIDNDNNDQPGPAPQTCGLSADLSIHSCGYDGDSSEEMMISNHLAEAEQTVSESGIPDTAPASESLSDVSLSRYMGSEALRAFMRRRRRHEANVFNAFFYDREAVTPEEIQERVERVARFFDLPVPHMIDRCPTLAMIVVPGEIVSAATVSYDLRKLEKAGINNPDAFETTITHEMSHQFVGRRRFSFCKVPEWGTELACDFLAGARCSAQRIASGKYRYAVSRMEGSATHPDGRFRHMAVKAGFDFAEWLFANGTRITAETSLAGFIPFLFSVSRELNRFYDTIVSSPCPRQPPSPGIDELPDSNLIKQAVMKFRSLQKKTDRPTGN